MFGGLQQRARAGRRGPSAGERLYRVRRIGMTFGRIYLGIKANQFIARRINPPDMKVRWSRFNRTSARSIYDTAVELQGLILKGCQFLGARADVLPPEYIETLSKLQDRVPPRPFPVIKRTVERALERPLEEAFPRFERQPIASASLAQVHDATLADGRRVAVKVQYPDIEALVRGDLANLRALFRTVGLIEREIDLMPLIEELATHVPLELDFVNEGHNAETIGRMFEGNPEVVVPEILWEHTRPKVLVMEFMEGIKITDVDALRAAGVDVDWVAQTLVEAYCAQVLSHGFFHADPHPGNLLVDPAGPRLVMVDFGLSKRLPPRFREGIVAFTAALLQGRAEAMVDALVDLGFETRDGSTNSLMEVARFAVEFGTRMREQTHADPDMIRRWNRELPEAVRENPVVRIPSHVILIGRCLGLLSGVNRSLGSRVDLLGTVLPYALGVAPRPS